MSDLSETQWLKSCKINCFVYRIMRESVERADFSQFFNVESFNMRDLADAILYF